MSGSLDDEHSDLIGALGLSKSKAGGEEEEMTEVLYDIVPDPNAENVDLSKLRGVGSNEKKKKEEMDILNNSDTDLENLAELVPDLKSRRRPTCEDEDEPDKAAKVVLDGEDVEVVETEGAAEQQSKLKKSRKMSMKSVLSADSRRMSGGTNTHLNLARGDSMQVQQSVDFDDRKTWKAEGSHHRTHQDRSGAMATSNKAEDTSRHHDDGYADSDHALDDDHGHTSKVTNEFMNFGSSAQSVSTATQTHEVRMPMFLPTFKPATGCTNASDFIVRCFVARLRSGITVVKHGRSRWCKSRLRILHIHPDGRSLSWKPAEGEPASSKRPPKLDLSTCLEVRHAWSPDPQNPMYTGTPLLRQKCEAANAHKSFALIFKPRTVDITAVTADQCKVLMEGFSALCFRLQVANLAGRGGAKKGQHARPMPEEDGVSTTASLTLTNTSLPPLPR